MDGSSPLPHYKPRLSRLLSALALDVDYTRGAGSHLYYQNRAGGEVEVLDLVGGYGTTLLGHSPPELVALARDMLAQGIPFSAQGSSANAAEKLAQLLSSRAHGDYCCIFTNSGSEAVEAALKHALLETGGRRFIALEGAFHGKTLGAVQTIGNAEYRDPFTLKGLSVERVPCNDEEALARAFRHPERLAGCLFELVLGEAGVRPLTASFVKRAAELCRQSAVPLIADECQTGCGRTGAWLASTALGIAPDYLVLSKALGGGLGKLGATLIRRDRYQESFDWLQTGTFAADAPTCHLAMKTVQLIDDRMLATITQRGQQWKEQLQAIAAEFPDVLKEVRGQGLMLGLEFHRPCNSDSFALRVLSSQDQLMPLVAAYLLRRRRIRVMPTLSDPWTLRLQPAITVEEKDWNRWCAALRDVCHKIRNADWPGLSDFLLDHPSPPLDQPVRWHDRARLCVFHERQFSATQQSIPRRRAAWLCHLIDVDDLTQQEPRLADYPFAARERLLERFAPLAGPVVMSGVDVNPRAGDPVRLYPILLPFSSRMARRWSISRNAELPRTLIREGIALADQLGCSVVALGQYNSILSSDGARLVEASDDGAADRPGRAGSVCISSGNHYTVALALQAIERVLADRGIDSSRCTLAVAGALGNIGSVCARILADRFERTLLLGSERRGIRRRLSEFAAILPRAQVIESPSQLVDAQVVVSAVSAASAPFEVHHFGREAVLCDISVPPSIRRTTLHARPDLHYFRGGIASLPRQEDLKIASYPLPPGQVFGCLAEAILLGWNEASTEHYVGPVTLDRVAAMARLADHFGMELGELKSNCVLGSDIQEAAYGEC